MKTFRIFVVMMAFCMLMTGCGKHTNPSTSTTPSGNPAVINDTNDTQNPTSQDVNSTTEATSQGNTNSGDYVSSDSRITPVRLEDYWISDTQFDFINYCRDQGATVKYLIERDGGGYTFCLPEDLAGTGKTPIGIGASFYFGGGTSEYLHVDCPFGEVSDTYWVTGANVSFYSCIGTSSSADADARIIIDDIGNTLSLSTINHLPIIFEYIMTLPYDSTQQDITNVFSAHYHDND